MWGALADPTRWRILEMLSEGELGSGEIAKAFALRWPTVCRHLEVLEQAGLVRKETRGRRRVYEADAEGFSRAASALSRLLPLGVPGLAPVTTMDPFVPVDAFIGRQRELDELSALLGTTRMLTVAGAPGVGKTRLARELAARVAGGFDNGVRWVELARVLDPAHVGQAIANVFDATERGGQTAVGELIDHLRGKHLLLVLDNCEHVRAACAEIIDTVLGACPRVTLLATSQAELATAAETVWRLAPLSLADGDGPDPGAESEAVQLFKARARMIRPGFAVEADGARAVREVCRQLDGIPLAIELAAARVGVLTAYEIGERLTDRFALLAATRDTDLERHQTLRGALDWSYGLLPRSQQQLLSRLSVFVGSADIQAAEAVCGSDSVSILHDLTLLVAASLVSSDTSGRRARYGLLETIRAYGAEQTSSAGETEVLRTRHLRWFLDLAERAEPELTGATEQSWLDQLDADEDNLRAALSWALESGDGGSALRLAAALVLYWRVRNRFREGRRWLEAALENSQERPASLRMRAHCGVGFMALMLNDFDAAVGHLDQGLALARDTGDARWRGRALLLLGNAWLLTESATTPAPAPGVAGMLVESAASAREAGDAWCLAHALSLLGWMRMRSGDTVAAKEPLEEALAVAREASDRQGLRLSLTILGRLALSIGDAEAAERLLSEAVYICEALGDGFGVGSALISLSELALHRGDYDGAEVMLDRAADVLKEAGPSAFRALHGLGTVALARGDVETARLHFTEAAAVADESNDAAAHIGLGLVALADGDLVAARSHFDLANSGGGGPTDAGALAGLSAAARAEGDLAQSSSLEHGALEIRRRLRDSPGMVGSLESLACIASEGGRHDHAARLFGAVTALSAASGLVRPPARQRQLDLALLATRRELGPKAFRAAFAAGKTLSLDHAADYATRGRGARRRPRAGWGSLTETEREVVALAVQGLSNAEIAKRLFISPHTAAWHLSQIYGKLGISSRTQLAHRVALRHDAVRKDP